MKKSILLAGIVGAAALCSCADDADSLYLNAQARFTFNYAYAVPILYTALNSPGQFCFASCKINSQGYISSYHFENSRSQTDYPATQILSKTYYTSFGGQGFIIGVTAIPDLSTQQQQLVAFDRICPTCYEETYITRTLEFSSETVVKCNRGHVYDLNNLGQPMDSTTHHTLYRYPIFYNGSNLVNISH